MAPTGGGPATSGTEGVPTRPAGYRCAMSSEDKVRNKVDELAGKTKESLGRPSGDPDLEAEGRGQQAASNLKQAGEKVKDAFR